jgi:hypothetical protein
MRGRDNLIDSAFRLFYLATENLLQACGTMLAQ